MAARTPHGRGKLLRERITAFLSRRRKTPLGDITVYDKEVILGTPMGAHTPLDIAWLYQENNAARCMLFGFYEGRNYKGHDIICKALPRITDYFPKAGASLQLNAALNLEDVGEEVNVTHHGLVSRPRRIRRETLVALMQGEAPRQARALGPSFPPESWPFLLGTTANPSRLVDRLYLYVSCIQAAKDAHSASQDAVREGLPASPADDLLDGHYTPGFAGKRRPYSVQGTIEVDSRHNFVVDALHKALKHALSDAHAVGATKQIDLYVKRSQKTLAVFEIKTDTETQNIYTAIGQLQYHGSNAGLRCIVLPSPPTSLVTRLVALGLNVLAYQWKAPTKPTFIGLVRLIEILRNV